MSTAERTPDEVARLLAAEFPVGTVKYRPGATSGNRARALAYVDARVVQDRLDDVLGVMGWQDSYESFPDGTVMCRLAVKIGGEWITKMDVGAPSDQPDEGDRHKAAVSDALKRAAVKFGVGRYLYRMESPWVDYDPVRKRLVGLPPPRQEPAAPSAPAHAPGSQHAPPPAGPTPEQVAYELKGWREWLDAAPGPDRQAVNETVRADLPASPREVKGAKWEMVLAYARKKGWGKWSLAENGFTEAREKVGAS